MIQHNAKFIAGLVFVGCIFPLKTIASDLSYDYVEMSYIESDIDIEGIDIDGDGYGFSISKGVAENLAVFFGYEDQEFDFDFEGDSKFLGIDYHKPFSESGDIVLSIAVTDTEVSQPVLGSEDDTGNVVQFGIRNQLSETAEIGFFVSRSDAFDDTESSLGFGLLIGSNDGIQLSAGYSKGEDTDVISIGVRINY